MKILFSKIVSQVIEIILNPEKFWTSRKNNPESQWKLMRGFFVPVVLVVVVAVFLGEVLRSSHFYLGYAVLKAVRELVLFILQYFIAVYFTNTLIKTFGGEKNLQVSRELVVFSLTPVLLVSIVTGLFPFMYAADILGIYSFYIFWVGVKELLVFPEQKENSYILITVVVNFFVFSFLSIFLSKLLLAFF